MAEERITTRENPRGEGGDTHTTVVHDSDRSGGGSGWVIAIILLLALVVGIYFFSRMQGSEVAKDSAVSNAAGEVGKAANAVGSAAQDAGQAARDTASDVAPAK
jgi:hypothetical protein